MNPDELDAAIAGASAVVHLAARPSVPRSVKDPVSSHHANATGTLNVLEAARRAGDVQVIVASSSSVYGSNPELPKHEDLATRPLSPYAASKLATEAYALAYGSSYGMPTLAFRFFNVFGPLQAAGHAYAAVVPASFGWSDIGSWPALHEARGGDSAGNHTTGPAELVDCRNVLVESDGPRVSVTGLEGVVVVVDGDEVLVTSMDGAQKVGKLDGAANQ